MAKIQTLREPEDEILKKYLIDIQRHPILNRQEETALAKEFSQTRNSEAARKMICSHLRLVVKIAMEYQSQHIPLIDLIQEGNLGLMQAVYKFDPKRRIRLSTYAQWWIRAYILKHLMDNHRLVKIGTTQVQRKLFFNLNKIYEELSKEGVEVTPQRIADRLQVPVEEVIAMEHRMFHYEIPIDLFPSTDEEGYPLVETLTSREPSPEKQCIDRDIAHSILEQMEAFRQTLGERDRAIWDQRMISDQPKTLKKLGEDFGISRERVRQLESRIMRRLQQFLKAELPHLNDFDFRIE